MKFKEAEPTLYIYAPNRTTLYGAIPCPSHLSINYRFNTFSEMSFEIKKYYYNDKKEKWVENPLYDKVKKNNLVKIPNDNPVFKYSAGLLYEDNEYDINRFDNGLPDYSNQPYKVRTMGNTVDSFFYTPIINHCHLQSETELFDVGAASGYGWRWYGSIKSETDDNGDVSPPLSGYSIDLSDIDRIMNESFFPVQVGDIISMGCQVNANGYFIKGANRYQYAFCPFFYSEANHNSCVQVGQKSDLANDATDYTYLPIGRNIVKNGHLGKYTYVVDNVTKTKYRQSGYVRFKGQDLADHSDGWWYTPDYNRLKILSGERRCSNIYTKTPETVSHGIPWWVIVNIEEDKDGINPTKKVTVYSYEYTLSNRSFSVDENTLPLYIPDNIPKLVTSHEFPIDRWSEKHPDDPNATTSERAIRTYCGAQRMQRGLMNQILDNLSGWKVRYVSSGVCTRYRQIEDVDNANIYTYLMNTVQSKYQCYIVFDTENLYINILSQSDMIDIISKSNIKLSWRNALKSMTIKDIDNNFATALKVHSEEDTYGLGLVNPNGTNVIYNFDNIKDELDYVADSNHTNNGSPYTLKQLVELYQSSLSTNLTNYRNLAQTLISENMRLVEYKTNVSEKLSEYHKLVDENNITVKLKYTNGNGGFPEIPPYSDQFNSGGSWYWGKNGSSDPAPVHDDGGYWVKNWVTTRQMHGAIQKTASNYWDAYNAYVNCQKNIERCIYQMKQYALKFSLNINTLKEHFATNNNNGVPTVNYIPIFTPTEAIELYKYIYEADWTNNNVVFNEKYSASDIYITLIDLYNSAKSEMDSIYCKPTYDCESDVANITRIPEMKKQSDTLFLGSSLYIYDDTKWIQPILLELKLDYDNFNYSPMVFTTDYNRKPKEMRFYELFSTIQQTSVETPTYTFDN